MKKLLEMFARFVLTTFVQICYESDKVYDIILTQYTIVAFFNISFDIG